MARRKFHVIYLYFGALPVLLWLPVGFLLEGLGTITPATNDVVIIALTAVAVFFILIPSSVLIFRSLRAVSGGRSRRYLEEHGRRASGVVLAVGESSEGGIMTVNENPYLNVRFEVHDGTRTPYEVALDQVVPRFAVPQVQPGHILPLKVHPEKPRWLMIDWAAEDVPPLRVGLEFSEAEERLLKSRGREGTARLLSLEDTGRSENFLPVCRVKMIVTLPGGEPYDNEVEMPLPPSAVERVRESLGGSVRCLVNPDDKRRVKLVFK
jgi:hypothetical protein